VRRGRYRGLAGAAEAEAVYGAELTLASLWEARSKTLVSSQPRRTAALATPG